MVYNETITLINYAKDIEIEYNIKLLLLFITFLYITVSLYLAFRWETDKYFLKVIKNFLIKLPFTVILFFYPLFIILLFRGVSWEVFYGMMIVFYAYSFVILTIAGYLGLFEYAAQLLGFKYKTKEMKL